LFLLSSSSRRRRRRERSGGFVIDFCISVFSGSAVAGVAAVAAGAAGSPHGALADTETDRSVRAAGRRHERRDANTVGCLTSD